MEYLSIIIVYSLVCGSFCGHVASQKGYNTTKWFWCGFFFGVIALIAIAGLSDEYIKKYLNDINRNLPKNDEPQKRGLFNK
jgi:small basic protein